MYQISVPIMLDNAEHGDKQQLVQMLRDMNAKRVFLALDTCDVNDERRSSYLKLLATQVEFFHKEGFQVGAWTLALNLRGEHSFTHMTAVSPDEPTLAGICCPADEAFRAFFSRYVKELAACGVDLIMLDDDFRYAFFGPHMGCLCDHHMSMIRNMLGEELSRSELAKRILSGGRNPYRDAWLAANGAAMESFARSLREAIDSVDPTIRLGSCACLGSWDLDGIDARRLAHLLAGKTKPFVRLIGAPYWAATGSKGCFLQDVIELERMESAWTRDESIEIMAEGDTYPRPRLSCPSSYLEGFDLAMRASGATDGILKYTKDFNHFLTVSSGAVGAPVAGDSVDGITTKMGMDFAPLAEGSKTRTFGLYGAVPSAESLIDETGKVTWNWQDITNSTEYAPKELQERRKIAAQYMYDMGTVYWTPSQNMMIINYKAGAGDRTSTKYSTTKLYRGIPYNHGSSNLDRFNYWVNNPALPTDAFYITDDTVVQQFNDALLNNTYYMLDGRKTLATITGDTGWKWTNQVNNYMPSDWTVEPTMPSVTGTYLTGFGRYIGNDCSSAAAWAWRNISAVANSSEGCARPNNTNNMFPSPRYMYMGTSDFTGIVPVNGLTFADPKVTNSSGQLVNTASSLEYAKIVNAAYDANPDKFLEAYTHASMGDCLMGYEDVGGHTRMLMGDAVTIRSKTGKILPDVSYVVTTEQGGGGTSGTRESDGKAWTSTWNVNKKRSFTESLRYGMASTNSENRYFPVTITALREVDTPAATAWCKLDKGEVTSNFHIVSTQVGDELIYTRTEMTSSRTSCIRVQLADVHTVTSGTVKVTLANGEIYTFEI